MSNNKYIHETKNNLADEACPNCGTENKIKLDATSTCLECGQKEILPCSECKLLETGDCDWNSKTGCTAFPKKQ